MQASGTHSPVSVFQAIVGISALRRCSDPLSVLPSIAGMPAFVGAPAHGRCSSPALDSGPLAVLRAIVSAPGHRRRSGPSARCGHFCRCSSASSVLRSSGAMRTCSSVLQSSISVPAHRLYAGMSSVLPHIVSDQSRVEMRACRQCSGLSSVPRQKNQAQAPSTTLYSAQHL